MMATKKSKCCEIHLISVSAKLTEIRLFKNTPIKLNAIIVDGKPIDISKIKDKVFRA